MIKFIYGKDTYRASQKLREIIEEYKNLNKNKIILSYFDCGVDFGKFTDEFKTISMFGEKKAAVLTNFFSDLKTQKEVLDFLKKYKKTTEKEDLILFYEEEKTEAKSSLFDFLKKNSDFQKFDLLKGRELIHWIEKEFNEYNAKLESGVPEKLAWNTGSNSWQISNEIRKLAAFKNKKIITKGDIDLLVVQKIEPAIFETIDAVSLGDKKRAIALFHNHLEKGDSPFYIFSMIKFQFSNLLSVKDLSEKRAGFAGLKMHPFVLRKSCQISQRFSLEQLKKIYKKIFQLDIKIKTGKIEPVLAMDILISEI